MPTCPKCERSVSILHWDVFGNRCAACTGFDARDCQGLLDEPCPKCGKDRLHATTAPALAYVMTKGGPKASKIAAGLFLIGCPDCGHAFLKFNRQGAESMKETPGWYTRESLRRAAES